jgi:hypothetical protein
VPLIACRSATEPVLATMNPEDFSRLLEGIFAHWNRGTAHAPLLTCLPEPVIEGLRAARADPSRLFFAELKRLASVHKTYGSVTCARNWE